MNTSHDEIIRIAKLSAIRLASQEEVEALQDAFGRIVTMLSQVQTAKVEHLEPLYNPLEETALLREDQVEPSPSPEALMALAPDALSNHYRVPKVIE